MEYFHYDDGACEPFFRRVWRVPFQTRPLRIKDSRVEMELTQLINKYEYVKQLLSATVARESSVVYKWTNMVRERLRLKLNNFKHNKFQNLLAYHLYEAMPEKEEIRKLLPSVDVQIPGHKPLSFIMKIQ